MSRPMSQTSDVKLFQLIDAEHTAESLIFVNYFSLANIFAALWMSWGQRIHPDINAGVIRSLLFVFTF